MKLNSFSDPLLILEEVGARVRPLGQLAPEVGLVPEPPPPPTAAPLGSLPGVGLKQWSLLAVNNTS